MEATPPQPPRQAACLVCRRSKIRCDWLPNHNKCKRCIQLDADCVRPAFHVGRRKGIKKYACLVSLSLSTILETPQFTHHCCSALHLSPVFSASPCFLTHPETLSLTH